MGVEYYVVGKTNKRMFWLGKGSWASLSERPALLPDWDAGAGHPAADGLALARAIRDRLRDAYRSRGYESAELFAWVDEISARLWAFCCVADWCVELRNDCSDYADESDDMSNSHLPYLCVLSRYHEDGLHADPMADRQAEFELKAAEAFAT